MNIIRFLKISIASLSSIIFILQTFAIVIKLINPPVVDSTTTLNIADMDLLVTLCPLGQWNTSMLNELGYRTAGELIVGLDSNKTFGWGAQHNLTFEDLVLRVQNFNTTSPQIDLINSDFSSTEISHEKNFYPQFGWCYDLVDLATIGEVRLNVQMGSGDNLVSQYKVFITDKRLWTSNTLHVKSLWGMIDIHMATNSHYVVKVDQLSYFDPTNPNGCKTYGLDDFNKCVDNELKKIWKPLINCNPPWLTSEDKCEKRINVSTEMANKIINKTSNTVAGIMQMKSFPAKERCFKPCTAAQSMVLFNGRDMETYNNHTLLALDFVDEVVYTTKRLDYGPSEFLIDMGSSLGFWFGLSVFGITDLGIMALNWINDMKRVVRMKYMD